MNEWRFNNNRTRECWTLIIVFQTKNNPENTFILFIFRVCKFWRGEKKRRKYTNCRFNLAFCISKFLRYRLIGWTMETYVYILYLLLLNLSPPRIFAFLLCLSSTDVLRIHHKMIQLPSLPLVVYQFCSREVRLRCICIRNYFLGKGFLHKLKHRIKLFRPMQQRVKLTCKYSNHNGNYNNKLGIFLKIVHCFTWTFHSYKHYTDKSCNVSSNVLHSDLGLYPTNYIYNKKRPIIILYKTQG